MALIANSFLWGNTSDTAVGSAAQLGFISAVLIANNIIEGFVGVPNGFGNSGNDPLSVDADGADNAYGTFDDDARSSDPSPARDVRHDGRLPPDQYALDGDGMVSELLPLDLLRQPRLVNGIADLGAIEQPGLKCLADIATGKGEVMVNIDDLPALINQWGPCGSSECSGDIDNDDQVDIDDLPAVINAWVPCP